MISWFNTPNEGLSPGGQLTLKTLTATENKTYSEEGTAYTGTINNTYTARVYGVNLYDLIGG